jgi:hypothetical protein
VELRAEACDRAADLGEARRRIVGHLSRRQDGAPDDRGQVWEIPDLGRAASQRRRSFREAHAPRDLGCSLRERRHVQKPRRLKMGPGHPRRSQGIPQVGEVVVGLPARRFEQAHRLGRPTQGRPDSLDLENGAQGLDSGLSGHTSSVTQEKSADLLELEDAKRVPVQS